MNISGGARRIRYAGRIIMFAAGVAFVLLASLVAIALLFPGTGIHLALLDLILIPALLAIPGAGLWLIGWIVEGFAEDPMQGRVQS